MSRAPHVPAVSALQAAGPAAHVERRGSPGPGAPGAGGTAARDLLLGVGVSVAGTLLVVALFDAQITRVIRATPARVLAGTFAAAADWDWPCSYTSWGTCRQVSRRGGGSRT